ELRNCCHGPVKCAISWEVHCPRGAKPDAQSANLEISAGSTESAFGYGACGDDAWQISAVKWTCETARTSDEPTGEIDGGRACDAVPQRRVTAILPAANFRGGCGSRRIRSPSPG